MKMISVKSVNTRQREITFYVDDVNERVVLEPIAFAAAQMGHRISFSSDMDRPSDVGVFACHANRYFDFDRGRWNELPSRVSVICAHDLGQIAHSDPAYFIQDGWQLFDLALVPNERFVALGRRAQHVGYQLPKFGLKVVGWPPSDQALSVSQSACEEELNVLRQRLGLDGRPTLLLACSWSNPSHIAQLKEAIEGLDLNVVARYPDRSRSTYTGPWADRLMLGVREIEESRRLASVMKDVSVPDASENLYQLLRIADIVVSNGSSVLQEGLLMGKPGVSITSWSHPSGPEGWDTVGPPPIGIPGIIEGPLGAVVSMIESAQDENFPTLVMSGALSVAPKSTWGRSAEASAAAIDSLIRRSARERFIPPFLRGSKMTI